MDFGGILTLDGFSCSSSVTNSTDALLGHKHGRSSGDFEETRDLVFAKMARTESKMCSELKREVSRSLFPNGAQMLSFSSPVKENGTSPYYYQRYPSVNELSMNNNNRIVGRVRGPFTPSQWMELEHQALIFKYIVQNAPVPTTLLVPIRRSLHSTSSFSPFSPFGSTPLGWGSLQLGYPYIAANCNGDAEPGRCRRTDGKKWRCSRDAVADQKYCERHINRGRHRSRKHVEPQRSTPAAPATGGGSVNGGDEARCLPDHQDLTRILTKETTTNQKPLETLFPNPSKPDNPFEPANGWTQQTRSNTTTNLSIAIPSSSPNNQDNLNLSPLTLSCNFNGGPLGEVLNNTSSNNIYNNNDNDMPKDHQSRSYDLPPSLNLLRDGWDLELSHNFDSSPTGVLKNNFGSVSSSNASSPRHETGAMCYDLIGSAIMKPHSITLL